MKLTDGAKFGDVVQADRSSGTLDVRKGKKYAETHPTALFAHSHVPTEVLEDAIFRTASVLPAVPTRHSFSGCLRGDPPMPRTFHLLPAIRSRRWSSQFVSQANSTIRCWLFKVRPGAGKPSRALE